jgi:hypothetical protein
MLATSSSETDSILAMLIRQPRPRCGKEVSYCSARVMRDGQVVQPRFDIGKRCCSNAVASTPAANPSVRRSMANVTLAVGAPGTSAAGRTVRARDRRAKALISPNAALSNALRRTAARTADLIARAPHLFKPGVRTAARCEQTRSLVHPYRNVGSLTCSRCDEQQREWRPCLWMQGFSHLDQGEA